MNESKNISRTIDSLLILHETLQFFEVSFENPELKLFFLERSQEN
jgi:hypothetical protein